MDRIDGKNRMTVSPDPNAPSGGGLHRILPQRRIDGISAVLLPFHESGEPDWDGFADQLRWVSGCGLTPAVNMDTGYVHLLRPEERLQALEVTASTLPEQPFVAGAFVEGEAEPLRAYLREVEQIQSFGGVPILFQCSAMKRMSGDELVEAYRRVAAHCSSLLAFELGEMFAPFGRIYDLPTFQRIMEIETIRGLKHSSLDRRQEWARLRLRDRIRPDFKVYTGNDLAIDMVMYGSDYLLGLAAFAPDAFALRDRLWAEGSADFFAVNDLLQYLGALAFRRPVPAYRHSAAQFLKLRGRLDSDLPHPQSDRRPESDREILRDIAERLELLLSRLEAGGPARSSQ